MRARVAGHGPRGGRFIADVDRRLRRIIRALRRRVGHADRMGGVHAAPDVLVGHQPPRHVFLRPLHIGHHTGHGQLQRADTQAIAVVEDGLDLNSLAIHERAVATAKVFDGHMIAFLQHLAVAAAHFFAQRTNITFFRAADQQPRPLEHNGPACTFARGDDQFRLHGVSPQVKGLPRNRLPPPCEGGGQALPRAPTDS